MSPRRVAAIDVGTNTVMLVVAEVGPAGRLAVVADEERFARLGQGVDGAGRLAPEAMDRVVARLAECRAVAGRLGAEAVLVAATSASRDAANVGELVRRVRGELGLDYRVIPGEVEGALSFRGALALLPDLAEGDEAVVVDVGGGSTEFVSGRKGEPPSFRVSLDVGSVRVTERFFASRPPTAEQVRAAGAFVDEALATVPVEAIAGRPFPSGPPGGRFVAVAGTAKVAVRLAGSPDVLDAATLRAWRDRLLALAPEETLALDPALLTGRADVSAAGLLILDAALRRAGAGGLRYSPGGLRHGAALAWAEGRW